MRRADIKLLLLFVLITALLAAVYSCSNPEFSEDTVPPTVDIINPEDGALVPNTVDVRAEASDNEKVARVEFYIDAQLYFTDSLEPWSCYWEIPVGEGDEHTIYAKAFDVSGNSDISETITVTCENTPPAKVTDLAATEPDISGNLTFSWTAPGGDEMEGTASVYDLRYYWVPITADNWVSATRIEGEPTPQVAGSSESFYMSGLRLSSTFYFALRTQDEVGNWSEISNVVEVTTPDLMGDAQSFSVGSNASSMTTGDFDGDGSVDIAVGFMEDVDNVSVFLNAGNGIFGSPQTYYGRKLVSSITSADIDNDGDIDLAIANYARTLRLTPTDSVSRVSLLENLGDGTFQLVDLDLYDTTWRWCSTIGYDPVGQVYICLLYNPVVQYGPDPRGFPYSDVDSMVVDTTVNAYRAHRTAKSICAADFNNDGWVDLAVTNYIPGQNTIAILKNNGDGTFPSQPDSSNTGRVNPNAICAGDFNSDGWVDIANSNAPTTGAAGTATIFLNTTTGAFGSTPTAAKALGALPTSICTGDVNGDGYLDLVIANSFDGTVTIWLRNPDYGNPASTTGTVLYLNSTTRQAGRGAWSAALADLCGDASLELVVGNNYDNNIFVMMSEGTFLFYPFSTVQFPAGDGPIDVKCADFDGDGDDDIAVLSRDDGTVTILYNRTVN